MSLTKEDLKVLSEPFDEKTICVKVQQVSKTKPMAGLVLYVQHVDVYSRIEQVDPAWSNKVISSEWHAPQKENEDGYFTMTVELTIKGSSRTNTGEGGDKKSANSDAIKRAAMLFGVARYLYDTETVWVPYDRERDRYKTFAIDEYMAALRPGQLRPPISGRTPVAPQGPAKSGQSPARPAATGPAPVGPSAAKTGIKPIVDPDAKLKAAAATEIILMGKKLGMDLMQLNDHIQELSGGKTLRDLKHDEMNYLLVELTRQYEGA